jgi:hypothetical protein
MANEGFFEKNFGGILSYIIDNLDLIFAILIWALMIKFFPESICVLSRDMIVQISGGLLLVTIGIAAFFGQNPKVTERLSARKTWIYAALIPTLFAAITILLTLIDLPEYALFSFLYSIFSTIGVSYQIINVALRGN